MVYHPRSTHNLAQFDSFGQSQDIVRFTPHPTSGCVHGSYESAGLAGVFRSPEGWRKPPGGGASGPAGAGGLSYLNKVGKTYSNSAKYGLAVNRATGLPLLINPREARLKRLQKRVIGFANAVTDGKRYSFLSDIPSDAKLWMVTLTHAKPDRWQPRQITEWVQKLKYRLGSALWAYCWVAEVQAERHKKTGDAVIHYHVLVWSTKHPRFQDRKEGRRGKAWKWGQSRVEPVEKLGGNYLAKYAGKEAQKDFDLFPKGARAFSVWVTPLAGFTFVNHCRIKAFPSWLQEEVRRVYAPKGRPAELGGAPLPGCKMRVRRVPGGGWAIEGEFVRSPWTFKGFFDWDEAEQMAEEIESRAKDKEA